MIKDVLVDIRTKEIRLAILEDGVVSKYRRKESGKVLLGIYTRGKVVRVLPGCNLHLLISDLIKMLICM